MCTLRSRVISYLLPHCCVLTALGRHCIDCGIDDADWGGVSYGVLLCLHCAGRHRSLGSHVSTIRSLTLDRYSTPNMMTTLLVDCHHLWLRHTWLSSQQIICPARHGLFQQCIHMSCLETHIANLTHAAKRAASCNVCSEQRLSIAHVVT